MIATTHEKCDINTINKQVKSNAPKFINIAEEYYYSQISKATNTIINNMDKSKIVLLSGPSGSTKTTTSEKITLELKKNKINSVVISLDNFFIDRDILPKLPNGDTDYESVKTLDMETLQRCLHELLVDKESILPIFDFPSGKRSSETKKVSIKGDTILIIEGIHAINPKLTMNEDDANFLKVYVSPNTDYLNDAGEVVISARDTRLIRRLIRDYFYRGNTLEKTFKMWVNVVASEIENIIPFKENADILIDTSIRYEPCIYGEFLKDIALKYTIEESKYQEQLDELLTKLDNFTPVSRDFIPPDTALHEFIK